MKSLLSGIIYRLAFPVSLMAVLLIPGKISGITESDNRDLPNIILIVSDDQGYNDIGAYGSKEIITPNPARQ